MKILNVSAQEIPACVRLPYRGFEISVSTTIFKRPSLIVLNQYGWRCTFDMTGREELAGSAEGIRQAMEGIDKYIEAGKPREKVSEKS
jgi:hypothetical protein